MATKTEKDWVEEIGAPAYGSIVEMVAALDCDYERLEELREECDSYEPSDGEERLEQTECKTLAEQWAFDNPDDAEELAELESAAKPCGNQCDNREDAERMIQEDALSVRVFGERREGTWEVDKAELLLCTGGPAVRIMVELDEHAEPHRAWLEVQNWFKPWTQYQPADQDTLLAYARCFYFGE